MNISASIFLLTICLVTTTPAIAADAFPDFPLSSLPQPTTKHLPLQPLLLGSFPIRFEETTLSQVQQGIGMSPLQQTGDGANALSSICYTLTTPAGTQRLWLGAGEMGGDTRITTLAAMILPAGTPNSTRCPELPAPARPVAFANGLWLGTTSNNALRILGHARRVGGYHLYVQETHSGEFIQSNTLLFRTINGKISEMHASRITSN